MTATATLRRIAAPVLAALLAAVGAWLFWDSSSRRAAQQAGAEAVHAAREAIPAIMSYQPATAENDLTAAANERLTGAFLDTYSQIITTTVGPEARQQGISASATVPAAAVVSADSRHAVVLAYIDQTVDHTTTAGSGPPTKNNSSVRVTMDKVDGRWLISDFDPI
jgi:Mce-associated membrane protein